MSQQDQSANVFFHNILNSTVSDISNNPREAFINYITSVLSPNLNENLIMLPMAQRWRNRPVGSHMSRINEIINRTLQQKKAYKKVLSEKGEDQLKKVKYIKDKFETDTCAISLEHFEEGQDIIQLPCNHIFDPESIQTWVKEECAKCPVCRYELLSKEVKDSENEASDADTDDDMPPLEPASPTSNLERSNSTSNDHDISNNLQNYERMFSNMRMIYNPLGALTRRPNRSNLRNQRLLVQRIINMEEDYLENRQMQQAIMNSLNYPDGTENNSNDEDLNELNFDAMHDDMALEDLDDEVF